FVPPGAIAPPNRVGSVLATRLLVAYFIARAATGGAPHAGQNLSATWSRISSRLRRPEHALRRQARRLCARTHRLPRRADRAEPGADRRRHRVSAEALTLRRATSQPTLSPHHRHLGHDVLERLVSVPGQISAKSAHLGRLCHEVLVGGFQVLALHLDRLVQA